MPGSICATCGASLKANAKFCTSCGAPVATATLSGDAPTITATVSPPIAATNQPTTLLGDPFANLPHLLIQDEAGERTVPLGPQPLAIGRHPDNDVVLASRHVSAHHARIEQHGQSHAITDLGSTNGLLYEGRRIPPNTPLSLNDGDVLRIGDPATGNFLTLTYRNAGARRAAPATQAARSYPLNPNDPQITIGRAGNDVVFDNPQVSRQHAVIDTANNTRTLRDVGSTNGTFVNGQRITQHTLRTGDIIQIGAFKLVYTGNSLDEYDQRGALRLDAFSLSRVVRRGKTSRTILKDVSLSIAPREFVALVGGSGTGKSTLLNALSGYAPAKGHVLINGDDFYRNFDAYRAVLGYVPQDDIIHRDLPVQRALAYAAELRLPDDTADREISDRIARVLEDVEMTPHRQTLVDNLSGGQRKRVSIGAELLADPSLFFLDEPTSGLDPGLEKKMMFTLRRLADSGRTVVLVTHATANITQCDHVAFMADGRLVYFGPPAEALPFFRVTSGDFADIYTKLDGHADPQDADHWEVVQRDLKAEYDTWAAQAQPNAKRQPPHLAELWEQRFRASPQYARFVADRLRETAQGRSATGPTRDVAKPGGRSLRISSLRQFGILARRYLDLIAQDRRNLSILLLQAPIIGALLALVAKSGALVGDDAAANEGKKVLFMLATVAVWFGIINAAREVAKEVPIYRRERMANLRIGPYVLSKVLVLVLLVVLQSAMLLGLVALKVQFPESGVILPIGVELFVTSLLTSVAGLAMGLAISSFASTPDRAVSLVPLALIPQILFAGVIFSLGDGITAQRILSWFTISRWAMDAFGTSVNLNSLPLQAGFPLLREPPDEYTYTPEHLLSRWFILLVYTVGCLLLSAWQLRRRDRRV